MRNFLTAKWQHLILANYTFDPTILQTYLPAGTELDFWQNECLVSLVGFMFVDTRVLGIKIPFHIHFPEVNLRFYVRHKNPQGEWQRGVVFIKEIVPKFAISFVANTFYGEPYHTMPMRHFLKSGENLAVSYSWKYKEAWQHLAVTASKQPEEIPIGSEAEFITEHYWGYNKSPSGKTMEYGVEHPRWRVHPVQRFDIQIDAVKLYGEAFRELTTQRPHSVFLVEGSAIEVRTGKQI